MAKNQVMDTLDTLDTVDTVDMWKSNQVAQQLQQLPPGLRFVTTGGHVKFVLANSHVNFPGKQQDFLHNLRRTSRFTHTKCDCALKLLKFYTLS